MTNPANRLSRAITARRGQLGMSRRQLVEAAGDKAVPLGTLKNLELERQQGKPHTTTLAAVDSTLGWEVGSAADIWDLGQPPRLVGEEPIRVEIVDGDDARALLAYLGDTKFTEESRRDALRAALAMVRALLDEE